MAFRANIFEENESNVRYYCRKLPALLVRARGAEIEDVDGRRYIDFLSACGALNYGHNHPRLKKAALDYLEEDGLSAALDFYTPAKAEFINLFKARVLDPRGLSYKLQFPGPTGANSIEAAVKLARKATGRRNVVAFTNAFHGMSQGALALTGSRSSRTANSSLLDGTVRLPYEGYRGANIDDLERFSAMLADPSGGIEPVAAFVIETIQGEGGLNVASVEWLRSLADICRRHGSLLIVDDIQAGCGRSGRFFSFEDAGIVPDIVCLAKSISGYGYPMALLLLKPELDVWQPGEHNGTFRGNSLAFVTAKAALELWTPEFERGISERIAIIKGWTASVCGSFGRAVRPAGKGMMQGLRFAEASAAASAAQLAIAEGVLTECCGPDDEVLKLLPPLNIELSILREGLDTIGSAVARALALGGRPSSLERDEAPLDPDHYGCDAVAGVELAHRVT